jgi:hypothetical protein
MHYPFVAIRGNDNVLSDDVIYAFPAIKWIDASHSKLPLFSKPNHNLKHTLRIRTNNTPIKLPSFSKPNNDLKHTLRSRPAKQNIQQRKTTMRPLKRLQMISLSLTLVMGSSSAFTTLDTASRAAASNKRPRVSRTARYFITESSAVESFHSLLDLQSSMAPTTRSSTMLSPEVEVLTDMSHMVMDFSGFFGPSKSLLRLCSVLGRILIIGADYLPDHNVHPEELVIQLVLLAINLSDVVKAVLLHQEPSDSETK